MGQAKRFSREIAAGVKRTAEMAIAKRRSRVAQELDTSCRASSR